MLILAVTSELTCIRMWSLRSGDMLAKFEGFQDPAAITTAGDGSLLVAFFDGSWYVMIPKVIAIEAHINLLLQNFFLCV